MRVMCVTEQILVGGLFFFVFYTHTCSSYRAGTRRDGEQEKNQSTTDTVRPHVSGLLQKLANVYLLDHR